MPHDAEHTQRNFWQAAWNELPAETRNTLEALAISENETPTSGHVEAIIQIAEQQKEEYESKQWTVRLGRHEWNIRNGIYEIVSWVQKFKEIGDVAVSVDPVHAAPPWAAFRFILQTTIAAHEKMEATMSILELVSRSFHHGRVLEEVYHRAVVESPVGRKALDNLQGDLVKLYVQILESLEYCQSELKKSTARRSASAFVKPDVAKNFLKELDIRWRSAEEHARDNDRLQLSEISSQLQRHLPDTMNNVSALLVKMEEDRHIKILEQISTIKFRSHHKFVHDQRTANTGEWLLNTPEFRKWQAAESSTITILYAGAGKTFLTSRVIDHLVEKIGCSGLDVGFGFFYCDRNDEKRRQPLSILRSLVRQFASPTGRQDEIHRDIQPFCRKLRTDCLEMDMEMCKGILASLITSYQSPIIVLDALDECDGNRSQLMSCLTWLMRESVNLKIFISSRKDHDIQKHFRSSPQIIIQATDNERDIEAFIKEKLAHDVDWEARNPDLQKEIIDTLFSTSRGMFQWAALQVQQILEIKHWDEVAVRESLKVLPATLEEAYQRIWEKIKQQQPHDRNLAKRAIRWVLCATRPLSTYELGTAIMINDKGDDLYDLTNRPSEDTISGICCNLLILDKEQQCWRFCHLSAAEYVQLKLESDYMPDHYAAICCIKYLSLMNRDPFDEFSYYVEHSWYHHAKAPGPEHPQLNYIIKQFFGHARSSSAAYNRWARNTRFFKRLRPFHSPLFGIVILGFTKVLKDWCESGDVTHLDLNECNRKGHTLLGLAAQCGHVDMCRFLIEKQVDIDKEVNPLYLLCDPHLDLIILRSVQKMNRLEMAKLLLDGGADPNARHRNKAVLDAALSKGDQEMTQLLASCGGRLGDAQAGLVNAARHGYLKWIEICLQSGAKINKRDEMGRLALVIAANYQLKAVELLLGLGADVNAVAHDQTALCAAAYCCRNDIMKLLLEAGAEPNPRVCESPIFNAACAAGTLPAARIKAIEFLLDSGADVNSPHSGSPLIGAMEPLVDKIDMVRMVNFLLRARADPNHVPSPKIPLWELGTNDGIGMRDPLSEAVYRFNNYPYFYNTIVSLLMRAGADPNKNDGLKNTLCLAARDQGPESLQKLLAIGADPTLTFTEGPGSALASAAFSGNLDACRFLLKPELGVDVNAPLHGLFDNVLIAAISPGYPGNTPKKSEKRVFAILNMMFEAGADTLMPCYLTLGPVLPATKLQHQDEYFIAGIRTFSKTGNIILSARFSKAWIRILWELHSNPMPHPPLQLLLGRSSPLFPLPPSANIIIKLTSTSNPYAIRYAGLSVSHTEFCQYLFINEKKKFELFGKPSPATSSIQTRTLELLNAQNLEDTVSWATLSQIFSKLSYTHSILLILALSFVWFYIAILI